MRTLFDRIARVAKTAATILLRGESGTGKELVARAAHRNSTRTERPFIAVNCAAIPRRCWSRELFGHEKGAFTGATARRRGKLELADGGTLFLDEIGELPLTLQAKLLRALRSANSTASAARARCAGCPARRRDQPRSRERR